MRLTVRSRAVYVNRSSDATMARVRRNCPRETPIHHKRQLIRFSQVYTEAQVCTEKEIDKKSAPPTRTSTSPENVLLELIASSLWHISNTSPS
jgi:hypothetical protein